MIRKWVEFAYFAKCFLSSVLSPVYGTHSRQHGWSIYDWLVPDCVCQCVLVYSSAGNPNIQSITWNETYVYLHDLVSLNFVPI